VVVKDMKKFWENFQKFRLSPSVNIVVHANNIDRRPNNPKPLTFPERIKIFP